MTDPTSEPAPPAAVHGPDIASYAHATTSDGRTVVLAQQAGGALVLRWWVPDARYADGWREVTDRDEIGALVTDINAHQAAAAAAVAEPEADQVDEFDEWAGHPDADHGGPPTSDDESED